MPKASTKDPIPRVVLLGRLALYGPHAARLHEEMLVVAARWVDPKLRKRFERVKEKLRELAVKDGLIASRA